ncbi:hypothetical protein V6N13_140089 [Hibiscus sabdariffa]
MEAHYCLTSSLAAKLNRRKISTRLYFVGLFLSRFDLWWHVLATLFLSWFSSIVPNRESLAITLPAPDNLMASVMLVNRSDSNWPSQPKGSVTKFMGKVPFSGTKPKPNPKFNKKRQFRHQIAPLDDVVGHVIDDYLVVT